MRDLHGHGEIRGDPADQDGDGVLVLGAQDAEIGRGGLGVLQGVRRFDDGDLIGNAGFVLRPGVVERFLVGLDGIVVELLQRILAADLEEVDGQAGLFGQSLVLQIGGAELCVVLGRADGVAHLSPQVRLPGEIQEVMMRIGCGRSPARCEPRTAWCALICRCDGRPIRGVEGRDRVGNSPRPPGRALP